MTRCRKAQGRCGEPLTRLAEVEVVDVRREPLDVITPADVAQEGFPQWTPHQLVTSFVQRMRCRPDAEVTRIEWRYLDRDAPGGG